MKSLRVLLFALLVPVFFACDDQGGGDPIDSDLEQIRKEVYELEIIVNDVSKGKVDITKLEDGDIIKEDINGVKSFKTKISDVIQENNKDLKELAALDAFLAEYVCDYEAQDGFRPSSKGDRCKARPCLTTKGSFVNLQTGQMSYEENPGQGCYNVKGLKKIILATKPAQ